VQSVAAATIRQAGADPFQFRQQVFQYFHATVEPQADSQTQVLSQPRVNGSHPSNRKCDSAALRTAVSARSPLTAAARLCEGLLAPATPPPSSLTTALVCFLAAPATRPWGGPASRPGRRDGVTPLESVSWQSAHYQEPYNTQRKEKYPGKMERLGLKDEDRSAQVLDTCCGQGIALSVLHGWGFTSLTGLDATPHPDWSKDGPAVIHEGDVMAMPFPDQSFDIVTNLHSLHHLGGADGVRRFVAEVHRVLRPGGRFYIIDFPGSPQIWLLFRMFRAGLYPPTGSLRNFAAIVDEEWSYKAPYLRQWPAVARELHHGPLRVARLQQRFFLYYLKLVKD